MGYWEVGERAVGDLRKGGRRVSACRGDRDGTVRDCAGIVKRSIAAHCLSNDMHIRLHICI